jgi:nitrite reductase/ring-hydroxylating ferredoxin subunit
MSETGEWIDVGAAEDFKRSPLREAKLGERLVAVSFKDGKFGVISNLCNHVGGPLGKGRLDGEFVVCPWHQYKFHRCTGEGEPGYEADKVPGYGVKEENGRLLATAKPTSKRGHMPHDPHPLTRSTERSPGGLRVGGISTTAMDARNPRFSTLERMNCIQNQNARSRMPASNAAGARRRPDFFSQFLLETNDREACRCHCPCDGPWEELCEGMRCAPLASRLGK